MQNQSSKAKLFFNEYKHLLWLLLLILEVFIFLLSSKFNLNYHIIHHRLDDIIPFVPAFIIPYCIWYAYVPTLILTMGLTNKKGFYFQLIPFYIGLYNVCILFFVYPTAIDFRPTIEQVTTPILWLCNKLFEIDRPINVFPSLHCFEVVSIHLSSFTFGPWKKKKALRIISAFITCLICLSTVFVKQHSIIDLIAGVLLAFLLNTTVYLIFKKRAQNH